MGDKLGSRKLIMGGKKSGKGNSLQGKMYIDGKTYSFFTTCDGNGNPKMLTAEDGTPLLYIQVTAFDNTQSNSPFGRGGGYRKGSYKKKGGW